MNKWHEDTWREPVVTREWLIKARQQHIAFIKSPRGQKMIQDKLRLQKSRCFYCDSLLQTYQVDHIKPLWKGGMNNFKNYVLACPACNKAKGANYIDQSFLDKRRYWSKAGITYYKAPKPVSKSQKRSLSYKIASRLPKDFFI